MSSRGLVVTLLAIIAFASLAVSLWPDGSVRIPSPPVHVALVDPYGAEPLLGYGAYRDALLADDLATISTIAFADDSYLAYRAARYLAELPSLEANHRLDHYDRVLALRVEDPLERVARRALMVDVARVAEAVGQSERAIAAYREALPMAAAIAGIERLEADPYRRASVFFGARLHRLALDALDGRAAPSIEGPANRALGNHARALDAFRRWIAEVPDAVAAREGEAWSLFSLERWDEADAAFAALPGGAPYGRGLVAGRTGSIDRGVAFLLDTGVPSQMWLATSWLEARGRDDEAIDAYLRIARIGDATYADDAAYRAYVLASRRGDAERAGIAFDLVPAGSFFGMLLGNPVTVPIGSDLAVLGAEHAAIRLARSLAIVHDHEAAVGELVFALRAAADPAVVVALAETLQSLYGEYRQSQRAAVGLISAGVRDERVWRLAYPRAYASAVDRFAEAYEIESALVWSIMRQESAFSPAALSHSNAQGLMQVIPSTWNWIAELLREPPGDPWDTEANVRYGVHYLRWLTNYHDDDLELVVTSYNRGQGYIRRLMEGDVVRGDKDDFYRHIDALETREYLQHVMVNLETYRLLYDGEERSIAQGD